MQVHRRVGSGFVRPELRYTQPRLFPADHRARFFPFQECQSRGGLSLDRPLSKRLSRSSLNNQGRKLGRSGTTAPCTTAPCTTARATAAPRGNVIFVSGSRRSSRTQGSRLPTQDSLRPVYLWVFIVPVSRFLESQRRLQS